MAYVNGAAAGSGGASSQVVSYSPTAANELVLIVQLGSTSITVTNIQTNLGGSGIADWTLVDGPVDQGTFPRAYQYIFPNLPSGITSVTVTLSGSTSEACHVNEFSGRDTSAGLGSVTAHGMTNENGTNTHAASSPSISAATSDDLHGCLTASGTIGTYTPGTGYTARTATSRCCIETADAVASGSYTPASTSSNNVGAVNGIIALKIAAAGGPFPPWPRHRIQLRS